MCQRSDAEILEFADRESLLVVSHDVNTMPSAAYARVAAGHSFPELFMVQQALSIRAVIDSLVLVWSTSELEEWKDQVVYLPFE